jgi:hypothetical protein
MSQWAPSLPGCRGLSRRCARCHFTFPPRPSGQLSTYTAPISSSSFAIATLTSASRATASHASHSSPVRGSLTVQFFASVASDDADDSEEEGGTVLLLRRASSIASRSGHGEDAH